MEIFLIKRSDQLVAVVSPGGSAFGISISLLFPSMPFISPLPVVIKGLEVLSTASTSGDRSKPASFSRDQSPRFWTLCVPATLFAPVSSSDSTEFFFNDAIAVCV
jgi:hypothetical protein